MQKEFPKESILKKKNERLFELNALLNMDEANPTVIEEEQMEEQEIRNQKKTEIVPKFGT